MAQHSASVTVNAPVDQVWQMWSHFNDYPKFMTYIKEVTYYDDQRSHWVADIVGHHEWDAVNENWIEGKQIGWRSTDGVQNSGVVTFQSQGENNTLIQVTVNYDPPAGFLGDIGEVLGAGKRFETAMQEDLNRFATMIAQAPPGALDPMSSNYLFHADSAAAKGETTPEQDRTMGEAGGTGMSANTSVAGGASTGSNTALRQGMGAANDLDPMTGAMSDDERSGGARAYSDRDSSPLSDDAALDSDISRSR